ncbi:hypothetical protein E4K72_00920 [Oxalobacteraceae bacterium OM1]|nr:hypothetical protein E4K72_00920 [Oxalobacteraceae bacterium OM1]
MKWITFVLMYLRRGPSLTPVTLMGYLKVLRVLCSYCEEHQIRIQDALADAEVLHCAIQKDCWIPKAYALINALRTLGAEVVGFEVVDKRAAARLAERVHVYLDTLQQHLPIPTRLYSAILAQISSELHYFECHLDRILALAAECYADPETGRTHNAQAKRAGKYSRSIDILPTFPELLAKYNLTELWRSRKYEISRHAVVNLIGDIQLLAATQLQAYSGMRHCEVRHLQFFCLEEVRRDGITHFIVKGRVTKLTKGKVKQVKWVTSGSGRHAIRIAQRVANVLYASLGIHPSSKSERRRGDFPLFLSPACCSGIKPDRLIRTNISLADRSLVRMRLQPIVEQADIDELLRIDPHRSWEVEQKCEVGKPWVLTSHQLRRSLALYAQRSGLVSLATLKRQLQHITIEMSLYYARGSAFAADFIGKRHAEKHFGTQWQEAQPISQALSYLQNVVWADPADLFGGHASWVVARIRREDRSVLFDRAATVQQFNKGLLTYRETPIGGCVNPGPCDKNPIDVLHIDCIDRNCKHLVGSFKKVESVIAIKSVEVDKLRCIDPTAPDFRHEAAELDKLVAGYEKAKRSKDDRSTGYEHPNR